MFDIANHGIEVQIGSAFDVAYEVDIQFSDGTGPIERRYEQVAVTITSVAPLRMQNREILSRSTFLP
ncbi:hypothetical protein [Caulobacter mirabilis]|nr:hypothetical protein [Caulobacter mirabilis]